MKLSVKLLNDDGAETGRAFEVKDIPSLYIGGVLVDDSNKLVNGYSD